jgi:pimeloyl-ACP methyl ester carboxylesterase
MRSRGFGVLAVEYPGYGVAGGSPSETSLVSAGREALVYARETLQLAPRRIILQGQSLGSGVASRLAVRGSAAKLVLISPFTSVTELASRIFPVLPARWLVRDRFDTRQAASEVPIPVLIVHGDRDEIVPFSMGDDLAHAFPNARLARIVGGHHNDLWIEHARELTEAIAMFAVSSEVP